MARANWKNAESKLAKLFGARRRPLSGSNQGTGERDDGMHPSLFLESKYSKYTPILRLYKECVAKAQAENKRCPRSPVIGLTTRDEDGLLLVIHSSDFRRVIRCWAEANNFTLEPIPPRKKPPVPKRRV